MSNLNGHQNGPARLLFRESDNSGLSMSIDPFVLPHYNIAKGMEFVALWVSIVFFAVLVASVRAQYRLMNKYDVISSLNPSSYTRAHVIMAHIKRLIFNILGYQGEERERQTLDELDAHWIRSNFRQILVRFCIFYFIYIWALILMTRALWIDPTCGSIQMLSYTSKQIFGFLMIGVYIISNSVCDILSIYFTVRHLEKIEQNPAASVAVIQLSKNLLYSGFFFFCSQLVSNLIWPLKTNVNVSVFGRIFSPAIALWPYAFVIDANSEHPELLYPIFPGQLLITGTVFLPTLIAVLLFVVLAASFYIIGLLKSFLVTQDLVLLGIFVTVGPDQKPALQFRCINALTVGVTSSVIGTAIFELVRHVVSG